MKFSLLFLITFSLFSCAHHETSHSNISPLKRTELSEKRIHSTLHFKTGSTELQNDSKPLLFENAKWMKANPQFVFILEGHADERGKKFYNLLLGDRRARKIKALLMNEGVHESQTIMIVSQGETKPRNKNHNYEAWRENRRVEFILR